MAKRNTVDLVQQVGELLEERSRLTEALAHVEMTLSQVGVALKSGPTAFGVRRKPGRPPGVATATAAAAAPTVTDGRKRRRNRKQFDVTAEDFVLDFVKSHKNPTTKDINGFWKSEGRGATADNTLTKLVKEGRLKRTPLGEGIRGSKYAIG